MTAFDMVYATVATDCHLPLGKNRHHKFKDKIVELWNAIEQEVLSKNQSATHPLYALGIKQLDLYRSVAKASLEKKKVKDESEDPDVPSEAAPVVAVVAPVIPPPLPIQSPRKKARKGSVVTVSSSSAPVPASVVPNTYGELAQAVRKGFQRLESLTIQQIPPKLPSPLHELHRLHLQLDGELAATLEPYYRDAIGAYLTQVTHQANNSAHPAMLPTVLDGLETLLQAQEPHSSIAKSIRYTFKHVLQAYLKLLNPRLITAEANQGKRKSKDDDSSAVAASQSVDV